MNFIDVSFVRGSCWSLLLQFHFSFSILGFIYFKFVFERCRSAGLNEIYRLQELDCRLGHLGTSHIPISRLTFLVAEGIFFAVS